MRFFNHTVSIICLTLLSVPSIAQSVLTDEDREIAEMAKQLRKDSPKWNLPVNPHSIEAKRQAADLIANHDNGLKPMMSPESKPKLAGRTVIFASMSLGSESLEEIFYQSSVGEGVIVAFRGVVDEKNFAKAIYSIQELAAKQSPVANVVIDPTLFRDFQITKVPTVLYLDEDKTSEVARVSGLSSPDWLHRKVRDGKDGSFGVRGPVKDIQERDLIEVMKEKVAGIDWAQKKEDAINNYWDKQNFIHLPTATKPDVRYLDPSIRITADIKDAEGKVLVPEGTLINPLRLRPFTQAVVVFDPLNKTEVGLVEERLQQLSKDHSKITLIVTQFDRAEGWDSYKKITDRFDAPVYNLTSDVHSRFDIQRTPSIITAENENFRIEELANVEDSQQ